jgi:NAD(P) transhydrogenase subunit alpha
VQIGIPRERADGERRVAVVPSVVDTYVGWGLDVVVEAGAGEAAGFPDSEFEASRAGISTFEGAVSSDIVLRVGPPTPEEIGAMHAGAIVAGFLDPFVSVPVVRALVAAGVTGIAVEAVPRVTIAQGMDALSSQANLAGYAAVLRCAGASPKLVPMMVTAAGTIRPCKALILGVGVAGLQAIATARRLGAVVFAYDVRPETKEQVESLGARFVEAPTTKADEGGYATQVDADTQARQHEVLAPFVADADMIVTTAQIPGRPAPLLITADMLSAMRPGSVIVDMAAATGGNVAGTRPDEVVQAGGVEIHGPTNLSSSVAFDASQMYARNLVAMLERMRGEEGEITVDLEDEIIGEAAVVADGRVIHPLTAALLEQAGPA